VSPARYDNCCSKHITNDLSILYGLSPLPSPIPIYGINGYVQLTHSGYINFLPETNNINVAYYSDGINVTLISLGYIQSCGGSYATIGSDKLAIYMPNMELYDTSTMGPNMTYGISTSIRTQAPSLAYTAAVESLSHVPHINEEQKRRCNVVQDLIVALGFPSDSRLCDDLAHGKIPYAPYSCLTPADVRLNRILRKACPHAAAGKHKSQPHPPSTTPPASAPGQVLSIDMHLLPHPAPGGLTQRCTIVDEHSGFVGEFGLKSKTTSDLAAALSAYIADRFTSRGHTTRTIHGDDEAINRSLAYPLATQGIQLQLSPAGEHARRVERTVQTIDNRVLCILSYLPYHLPLQYILELHMFVASTLNNSINSRSKPLTPSEIVLGSKPQRAPVPFGSCWNVTMSPLKRRATASTVSSAMRSIPKVEIGVCMGPCGRTGATRFLLSNGEIVSRLPQHPLPDSFVPFNWVAKEFVIRIPLPSTSPTDPSKLLVQPAILPCRDYLAVPPDLVHAPQPEGSSPLLSAAHTPSQRPRLTRAAHSLSPYGPASNHSLSAITTPVPPASRSGHATRKLQLSRLTTARNKHYRSTLALTHLTNAPTPLFPDPDRYPPRQEVKYSEAVKLWGEELVHAAFVKEVQFKQFTKYKSLRLITADQIEHNAIKLHSQMLYKMKLNGTVSGRLPADGSRQPPDSYSDTYAATSDQTNRNLLISTMLKDCANRATINQLVIGDFDIPAAFINGLPLTRDKTGGRQVVMRLPHDLPDAALAGRWVEVLGCIYGMKQSNHEFDKSFDIFLRGIGYKPLPSDTKIYVKKAADGTRLVIDMHVDDGFYLCDNPAFLDELEDALKVRYGSDLSFSRDSSGVCSVRLTRLPNNDVKLDAGHYIAKQLVKWGMTHLPPALTPSLPGLFAAPLDPTPTDRHDFQVVNGGLIHLLPIRGDIALEVGYLCSRNQNPTVSDRAKQIHLCDAVGTRKCPQAKVLCC